MYGIIDLFVGVDVSGRSKDPGLLAIMFLGGD